MHNVNVVPQRIGIDKADRGGIAVLLMSPEEQRYF